MSSMLVGVRPTDLPTFAAMVVLFALVVCWLPARRAAGLDPTVALRDK
jgi:ABC-type lipoprotein release transport system permease subunit